LGSSDEYIGLVCTAPSRVSGFPGFLIPPPDHVWRVFKSSNDLQAGYHSAQKHRSTDFKHIR
jgi:hypothetical protein